MANVQELQARITLRDEITSGLKNIQGQLGALNSSASSLESAFSRSFASIATSLFGVTGAIAALTKLASAAWNEMSRVADKMDEIGDAADRLRIAPDRLQALRLQAVQLDASVEELNSGLKFLSRNFGEAISGSEEARAKFDAIGVDVDELKAKGGDLVTVLRAVADRFKGGALGAREMSVAMDLLGRGADGLIPLLRQGGDGLAKFEENAKASGQIIRTDLIKEVDALKHKGEELDAAFDAMWSGQAVRAESFKNSMREIRNVAIEVLTKPLPGPAPNSLGAWLAGGMNVQHAGAPASKPSGKASAAIPSFGSTKNLFDLMASYPGIQFNGAGSPFGVGDSETTNIAALGDPFTAEMFTYQSKVTADLKNEVKELAEENRRAAEAAAEFNKQLAEQSKASARAAEEQAKYDAELAAYNDAVKKSTDAGEGFKAGIQDYVQAVGLAGDQMRRFAQNLSAGTAQVFETFFFDVLDNRIRSLKDAFEDLGRAILRMIMQVASAAAAQSLTASLFGSLFAVGAAPAGGAPAPTPPSSSGMGLGVWGDSFASGGYLGGSSKGWIPMKGYAFGGPIYRQPHVAMIGEGSSPEAVVPLPDGRSIPVSMRGGGRGTTVFAPIIQVHAITPGDGLQFLARNANGLIAILASKLRTSPDAVAALS